MNTYSDIQLEKESISNPPISVDRALKVTINRITDSDIEFDLIGVDASFSNAIRRVLIAEIPTMAIDKCYILNNTSIMNDEVLAHRLGLIPILAPPKQFEFKTESNDHNDKNTIVFELNIQCPSDKKCLNVYSSHLKWVPQGNQSQLFKNRPIKPVHDDILVTKLAANQIIHAELHCEKNCGNVHAKWSPVATATYRLLPEIIIHTPILGDDAIRFAKCFSPGTIAVKTIQGKKTAVVINSRNDLVSRECLRHPEFESKVILGRKKNHFIFTIESTGIIPPVELLNDAFCILIKKCDLIEAAIQDLITNSD